MVRFTLLLFMLLLAQPSQANPLAENFLNAHNQVRQQKNLRPLLWSNKLTTIATNYAHHLATQKQCQMIHSHHKNIGENLFWASPITWSNGKVELQPITPQKVVQDWASEERDYDYRTNRCNPGKACGHYTQIVWKSTEYVGCGFAICAGKAQIWVCNYSPPGNYIGQRPY
ncbi:CAP domain-containing protein [Magnetococcales bacterium HHB-1]